MDKIGKLKGGTYIFLVRSLYATLVPTAIMAVSFLAVGTLVAAQSADPLLATLTALGTLAAAGRLVNLSVYRDRALNEPIDPEYAALLERRFALPYLAFAILFGIFAARAFQVATPEAHMLVIGLMFGYAAGVAAGISLRPWIAASAMLFAIVPTIPIALFTPDIIYRSTGVLLALFLVGGINSVFQTYRLASANIDIGQIYADLARSDDLTGLHNRLSLREEFQRRIAQAGDGDICVVHCLDLDRFKPINDKYGHPVGDALLRAVSERLNGLLRRGDIAARLGGDEFVIVQTGARHPGEAELLARRIVKAIAEPFTIMGHRIVIGTSIGYALQNEHGRDLDTLIGCADAALVRVKSHGGGIAAYGDRTAEPEMRLSA